MHLELTETEAKMLRSALSKYETIKRAERMLTAHKEKSAEAMAPVFARYDALLVVIDAVQAKLA